MKKKEFSLSHILLVVFIFFIYARPYQFITALEPLKLTKVSMILVLILSIFERKKSFAIFKEKSYKYLVYIHLTAIALIPFSLWRGGSFNSYISGYLKLFVTFHVLMTLINNKEKLFSIINTIFISLTVIAVGMIKAYKANQVVFSGGLKRVEGVATLASGDPNDMALALAMILPVIFYFLYTKKGFFKTSFYLATLLMTSITIVFTGSRGGYLGVITALLIFFYNIYQKQKQKFIFYSLCLSVIIIIFMPPEYKERFTSMFDKSDYNYSSDNKGSGRLAIWKRGLKTVIKKPYGTGFSTYTISEGNRKRDMGLTGAQQVAHNSYLQIAVELGILGFILYLLLLKSAFDNLKIIIKHCEETNDKNNKILAIALKSSLSAFLVASFFLSQAYYWNHYIFIALIATFKNCIIQDKIANRVEAEF